MMPRTRERTILAIIDLEGATYKLAINIITWLMCMALGVASVSKRTYLQLRLWMLHLQKLLPWRLRLPDLMRL